nr:hypothetical protein [Saprospiraceae bacterium]
MKGIKSTFFVLLFISIGQALSSQQYEPKLTFGLNFGRTFPMGKFADFQDGLGGRGRFLHFQAGYLLNKEYTINATLQLTGVGNRTINNRYGRLFPDFTIYYNRASTMLSFYPSINKKIFLDHDTKKHWLNAFFGIGVEMNQSFLDRSYFSKPNSYESVYIDGDLHFSPVFVLGGSYERFVYKGLFIKVLLDYQISNFGTEDILFEYVGNRQNPICGDDVHFGWLSRINIGVGFGVRFPNIFKPKL